MNLLERILNWWKKSKIDVTRETDRDLDMKTNYPGRKIREDEGKKYTVISKTISLPGGEGKDSNE